MIRFLTSSLLALTILASSGCVASMAASAVGMAVSGAKGAPQNNQMLQPAAAKACSNEASKYGAVHIIDVEQHSISKIIVWGTVEDGGNHRSFECDYGSKITSFKLRSINESR